MNYYNVHSHSKCSATDIRNIIFSWDDPISKGYYSVGAHPLFYEWTKDFYSKLYKICMPKAALAVGECGLDKRSPMQLTEQIDLFMTHVHVSEELKKPLIIHCVGYFNELSNIMRETKPTQQWVIHGFRKNPELASSLVKQGFYFSLGREGVNRDGIISVIPFDRLFLETDEDAEMSIEELYALAAATLGIDVELLAQRIEQNFNDVFLKGTK